jgi:hypothetical protein
MMRSHERTRLSIRTSILNVLCNFGRRLPEPQSGDGLMYRVRMLMSCDLDLIANAVRLREPGSPQLLPNILKVERSKLGYIIGTIYMEMPLKPNILEDLARDVRSCFLSLHAGCNVTNAFRLTALDSSASASTKVLFSK